VPAHYGIRTEGYKLIFFYGRGLDRKGSTEGWITPAAWELYDLEKDPLELNNIYGQAGYESITMELKQELNDLKKKYGDQDDLFPILMQLSEEE